MLSSHSLEAVATGLRDQMCTTFNRFRGSTRWTGREHDDAAKSDDGMRTSPVCDLPGDRRKEHADRTDDAEQAGDFGAEVESGVELQREDSPEGAERAEQTALDDGRLSQFRLFPPEDGQRFEEGAVALLRLGPTSR
jgi:hypothetical protein